MSLVRIELDVVGFYAGLADEDFHRLIRAETDDPPMHSARVNGTIIERLRCVSALLLGPATVGIERLWEVVDVLNLDKNWRN